MKSEKYPVTIATGCLGSGKTTLLSEIFEDPKMTNTAVLVNEFGKVGLDHHLLRQVDEETVLLDGGCVCCNRREDLEKAINNILHKVESGEIPHLDRVVLETTGLADPAPIIFTILTDPVLQNHFYIDCVVTTLDAVNGELHIKQQPEAIKQLTAADKVIITKVDLSSEKTVENLIAQVHAINPAAHINQPSFGDRRSELLFGGGDGASVKLRTQQPTTHKHELTVESNIQSISFSFDQALDWTAFGVWLSMLLHARGEEILRVKGMLDVGESGPVVLNGVQHIIHPPEHLAQWPENEKFSHLVFIVKSVNPETILESLQTFQDFLGSKPEIIEINAQI